MARLSDAAIQELMIYCLFKNGESTKDAIMVEGIIGQFGFHPGRIAEKTEEINALLNELADPFRDSGGSFQDACEDRYGRQWTGLQMFADQLFCLGMATGKVNYCAPREMWPILPGGVPYLVVKS